MSAKKLHVTLFLSCGESREDYYYIRRTFQTKLTD